MKTFKTSRQIAASPNAIFEAMRQPDKLAKWWGPDGFTNIFDVFEFKNGGKWIFTMTGPDGKQYLNESVFSHIEANRQVVIKHICQPIFQLTITLEGVSGGTLLHWEQTLEDDAFAEAVRHIIEPANEQNLNRLSAVLGLNAGSSA